MSPPLESFPKYQPYVTTREVITESNSQLCSEDLVSIEEVEKQDQLLQEAFVCEIPKTEKF